MKVLAVIAVLYFFGVSMMSSSAIDVVSDAKSKRDAQIEEALQ